MDFYSIITELKKTPPQYKMYVSQLSCLRGYPCDELIYDNDNESIIISSSEYYKKHLTVDEVLSKLNKLNKIVSIKNILCNENNSGSFNIDKIIIYDDKQHCVCVAL